MLAYAYLTERTRLMPTRKPVYAAHPKGRYRISVYHGEGSSLFHVVDTEAPVDAQPLTVGTYTTRKKALDRITELAQPKFLLINIAALMTLLTDWHTDEVTDRAEARSYARRFMTRLKKECAAVATNEPKREACRSCWTTPIPCTEGCGAMICTCNISTHDCKTFKAGDEA